MQAWLQTDFGFYVALCCLIGGLADLTLGWWLMGRHEQLRRMPEFDRLRSFVPFLLLFDIALVAFGWYGLRMHMA